MGLKFVKIDNMERPPERLDGEHFAAMTAERPMVQESHSEPVPVERRKQAQRNMLITLGFVLDVTNYKS